MSTTSSQSSTYSSTLYPNDHLEVFNWELRAICNSFIKTRKLLVKTKREFEEHIAGYTDRLLKLIDKPDVITRFEDVPIPPCIDTFIERVENEHFENNGQAAQAYKEFEIQALHSYITCLLASTCHILQVIVKQDELGPPPAVDPQHFETVCEAENKDPHAEIEEHYDNTIRRYREGLEPFKALCDFSGAQTATIKRERALISPDFLRNWLSLDDDRKSDRLKTRLKFIRRFSEREVHATFSYVTRAMVEEIGAIMLFKEQDACLKASDRLIKWILRFGGWLYEEDSSPSYWYGGAAEWVWG